MADNLEHRRGLLTQALLDGKIAQPRGGGLGALASILADEAPKQPRRGLLNYASALDGLTALPPVTEAVSTSQQGIEYVIWHGVSGTRYRTELNLIGASYNPREGVYIFCKIALNGNWDPVYVGETNSFQRRLTDELMQHHRWPSIMRAGATHICTLHLPGGLALREGIETDLRHQLNPPCNLQ
jgi:hypothetical protein